MTAAAPAADPAARASATVRRRKLTDRAVTVVLLIFFVLALLPLVSVLYLTVTRGLARFDLDFFTHSLAGIGATDPGGGAYHAIVGTVEQVLLASAISVPLALFTAIYLVEYGEQRRFARAVSYVVDVMTGVPSIVAGLFVFTFWILALHQSFSGLAGALSLVILMVPVVVRGCEEMLRLVPRELREASYALGIPRWKTIVSIVLPTAMSGLVTAVLLGVARVTGETAPLLLTVFGAFAINPNPFSGPQSALPLFVFDQAQRPNKVAIDRAWTAALALILIVLVFNLVARLVAARRKVG